MIYKNPLDTVAIHSIEMIADTIRTNNKGFDGSNDVRLFDPFLSIIKEDLIATPVFLAGNNSISNILQLKEKYIEDKYRYHKHGPANVSFSTDMRVRTINLNGSLSDALDLSVAIAKEKTDEFLLGVMIVSANGAKTTYGLFNPLHPMIMSYLMHIKDWEIFEDSLGSYQS